MVYYYYLKFKVVSSSKDALIMNNMYGHSEIMKFLVLINQIMYFIKKGNIYSQELL